MGLWLPTFISLAPSIFLFYYSSAPFYSSTTKSMVWGDTCYCYTPLHYFYPPITSSPCSYSTRLLYLTTLHNFQWSGATLALTTHHWIISHPPLAPYPCSYPYFYKLGLAPSGNCLSHFWCYVLHNKYPIELLDHFWWSLNQGTFLKEYCYLKI